MSERAAGRPGLAGGIVARPWLLVFLPVNAAASSFSVALPLLILFTFHGNILEVALASTLYNFAVIPASLIWGFVCDRLGVRSPLLLLNYVSFAVLFLVLAARPSLPTLLAAYMAFGFVAPSSAAASNLLILERFSPEERPSAYASFSELSMIGNVLGVLLGFVWLVSSPAGEGIIDILYISTAAALTSAVGVALFIRDPPVHHPRATRATLARHPESLDARLRLYFPFFPKLPTLGSFRRIVRWLEEEATHEVPLMLAAGFFFGLGSSIFNTSYAPYMVSVSVAASGIFLVNLSNSAAQALVLPFTGRACEGGKSPSVVQLASWGRVVSYASVFGLALLPAALFDRNAVLGINILAYGIIGVTYAFYSTSSSLLLFRSLEGRSAGSLLGANSALGGLAAVLGAAASGVASHELGYDVTFALSAALVAVAVPAWLLAVRSFQRRTALQLTRTGAPQRG